MCRSLMCVLCCVFSVVASSWCVVCCVFFVACSPLYYWLCVFVVAVDVDLFDVLYLLCVLCLCFS